MEQHQRTTCVRKVRWSSRANKQQRHQHKEECNYRKLPKSTFTSRMDAAFLSAVSVVVTILGILIILFITTQLLTLASSIAIPVLIALPILGFIWPDKVMLVIAALKKWFKKLI